MGVEIVGKAFCSATGLNTKIFKKVKKFASRMAKSSLKGSRFKGPYTVTFDFYLRWRPSISLWSGAAERMLPPRRWPSLSHLLGGRILSAAPNPRAPVDLTWYMYDDTDAVVVVPFEARRGLSFWVSFGFRFQFVFAKVNNVRKKIPSFLAAEVVLLDDRSFRFLLLLLRILNCLALNIRFTNLGL